MIKFKNIFSGEVRELHDEPAIAAFWGTSDRGPNAHLGQDMGWRLAPEMVVEVKKIKRSQQSLNQIAVAYKLPLDGITETDILHWISDHNEGKKDVISQEDRDFEREYQDEIRQLEDSQKKASEPAKKADTKPAPKKDDNPEYVPEPTKTTPVAPTAPKAKDANIEKSKDNKKG